MRYLFLFLWIFLLWGCAAANNPVDAVLDVPIKALDTTIEILENPVNKSHVKQAIYKEKINYIESGLNKNKYYNSKSRQCKAPKYPDIPKKPNWQCTEENIRRHKTACTIIGASEYACGEVTEQWIEKTGRKIYSGAVAGSGCVVLSTLITNGEMSSDDIIASGVLGGIDNAGEELMNDRGILLGGLGLTMRVGAGLGKIALVQKCQRKVELSCRPEIVKEKIRSMQTEYNNCNAKLTDLKKYL
jgi:hypothetical protein